MNNGEFLKTVGSKVRAARKQRQMTLKDVCSKTGLHISNVSFFENGRINPHLLTLKIFADLFEMDVKDFL